MSEFLEELTELSKKHGLVIYSDGSAEGVYLLTAQSISLVGKYEMCGKFIFWEEDDN